MEKKEVFKDITDDMLNTFIAKNADYGNAFSEMFREYGMNYALMHIEEKLRRIKSINRKGQNFVQGESFRDSLLDCANYCILTLMELRERDEEHLE